MKRGVKEGTKRGHYKYRTILKKENQIKILKYIRDKERFSINECAKELDINRGTIARALNNLYKFGLLKKEYDSPGKKLKGRPLKYYFSMDIKPKFWRDITKKIKNKQKKPFSYQKLKNVYTDDEYIPIERLDKNIEFWIDELESEKNRDN